MSIAMNEPMMLTIELSRIIFLERGEMNIKENEKQVHTQTRESRPSLRCRGSEESHWNSCSTRHLGKDVQDLDKCPQHA